MSLDFEKDFDDEVYEDSFYSEEEEELEEDEDELVKDELAEEEDDEQAAAVVRLDVSFVCDDCDYRWDDNIAQKSNDYNEAEDITDCVCPMCGSMNVAQI
ncbi:MAG: hypothetical protein PF637_06575 [Spirochaetes bacterium]|jgi:rubrerythrin|nr:hypothetical protein [Spirochaetota bacterium]